METTLSAADLTATMERLRRVNTSRAAGAAGKGDRRQPVHTVYGGGHLFKRDTAARLGELGLRSLASYAPDAFAFARAIGLAGAGDLPADGAELRQRFEDDPEGLRRQRPEAWLALTVHQRVVDKLRREPVEDFRIDFEDGYGNRPAAEEDGHAAAAAGEVAAGMEAGSLPPFLGLRIKPFTEELKARAVRTLDIFLTALCGATGGRLPGNLVVTLPKVVHPEQVATLASLLGRLEEGLGLPWGGLPLEIMIETPRALLGRRGEVAVGELVAAADGRCIAAHFGTYDYTASLEITAAHQHMEHPACGFARHLLQLALAGSGVWLSDGATNILPVAPRRADAGGAPSPAEEAADRRAVHAGWRLHYRHVRSSLERGYYQGWDLHPAQLPTRYAAVFAFFLEGLEAASARLRNFVGQAGRATLAGDVFDDAATGQGLLNYFLRAIGCGALTEEEARQETGLSADELRTRSFVEILRRRGE